jgi:hypothetical protein
MLAEKQAKLIADSRPVPCSVCGDVINAGTYGFIYNSINSPFNVIKGFRNGIFMIDFDKVQEKITPVTPAEIKNLLDQDMFPDVVRASFSSSYKKKYLKYKKNILI